MQGCPERVETNYQSALRNIQEEWRSQCDIRRQYVTRKQKTCSSSIAIRLPTHATFYFVYLFPYFTLHVSGSHKPIIRGISSCFLYTTIWFLCWTRDNNIILSNTGTKWLYIKNSLRYPWWWAYESPKHVG